MGALPAAYAFHVHVYEVRTAIVTDATAMQAQRGIWGISLRANGLVTSIMLKAGSSWMTTPSSTPNVGSSMVNSAGIRRAWVPLSLRRLLITFSKPPPPDC